MTIINDESSRSETVRVGLPVNLSPAEVSEYLFRDDVVPNWLGSSAELPLEIGATATLLQVDPSQGQLWTEGNVTSAGWLDGGTKAFCVCVSLSDGDQPSGANVEFRVIPSTNGGSKVKVKHSGLRNPEAVKRCVTVWQSALNRLGTLLSEIEGARKRTRQAIVVVHGVGEQRPGQTLRRFVDAVFPDTTADVRYIKPDYASELFEMRKATVPGKGSERPTTDVYELYWAHLIRDTSIGQVYAWILKLLLAPTRKIPSTLVRHVWALRILPVIVIAVAGWLATVSAVSEFWEAAVATVGVLALIPTVLWAIWHFFRDQFLLGFAGDAARYLEPKPGNVKKRQQIREAGVKLLDALHDTGQYERIIVYGHSLGSVIAYDILSHSWIKRSRKHRNDQRMKSGALVAVENLLNPRPNEPSDVTVELVQQRQHAAWQEYRRNGFEWLVSDFVTAGSPLAHARWLLNLDKHTQFDDLVEERSMPTCPPQTELSRSPRPGETRKAFTFTHAYPNELDPARMRSVQVPHHAALFALTRWSNLYFPFSGVSTGDPIAGPLQDTFGPWINDMKLVHPGEGFLGFAHTLYSQQCGDGSHVDRLRDALVLSYGRGLEDPMRATPND